MRNTFLIISLLSLGLAGGCGSGEVKEKADPDPRVSNPYAGSELDADSSKSQQDSKK